MNKQNVPQLRFSELFDTSKQNISLQLLNILKEKELSEKSVVKDYLTTASEALKQLEDKLKNKRN